MRRNLIELGQSIRHYCYKPIKRVSIDSLPERKTAAIHQNDKLKPQTMAEEMQKRIQAAGPITVAQYMKEVLTSPNGGYYMQKDVFGREGDFTTSPEITQIFGELIAIWCLLEWRKIGAQYPLQIVELGPGRGTLSSDLLRVLTHFGLTDRKLSLHLVEVSPHLSKMQAELLCSSSVEMDPLKAKEKSYYRMGETITGIKIFWYEKLDYVPKKFSIYLAHEFFDALPIHKFEKVDQKWREVLVDLDAKNNTKFLLTTAKRETPHSKLFQSRGTEEKRAQVEYSFDTEIIINQIAERLFEKGGFGLIIDYGHLGDKSDTFRAFKNHKLHDPMEKPGTADLTADVDFMVIKKLAERDTRLVTYGPVDQGDFLRRMGGEFRLNVLLENAPADYIENLKKGYAALTDKDKMGSRFKMFAMYPHVLSDLLSKNPATGFVEPKPVELAKEVNGKCEEEQLETEALAKPSMSTQPTQQNVSAVQSSNPSSKQTTPPTKNAKPLTTPPVHSKLPSSSQTSPPKLTPQTATSKSKSSSIKSPPPPPLKPHTPE